MIDFEEELKKFQPSLEVEEAEEAIYNQDLTDMTDILKEMLKDMMLSMRSNAWQRILLSKLWHRCKSI